MNILTGSELVEPENYEGISFSFPSLPQKRIYWKLSSRGGKKFRVRPEIHTAGPSIYIYFFLAIPRTLFVQMYQF